MAKTVVVFGARGRFGLAAARAFAAAGWRVIGQMRPGAQAPQDVGIEWRGIELQDTAALAAATLGAQVVVHALNPSAYTNAAWQAESRPMIRWNCAGVERSRARTAIRSSSLPVARAMDSRIRSRCSGRVNVAFSARSR